MLKFSFLTNDFYNDYSGCPEIEQKINRPHIMVTTVIDGVVFAIPLRSHISHPHVLWTDKANNCGVDFSKAVVIEKPNEYLDASRSPYIRPKEFKVLKGKEHQIEEGMRRYMAKYKKAKAKPNIPRNVKLLRCSTLQYFEKYI